MGRGGRSAKAIPTQLGASASKLRERSAGHGSSNAGAMSAMTRTYRFVITVEVEPDHPAYDDGDWAADAAHGALTNEYGLKAIYTDLSEVTD